MGVRYSTLIQKKSSGNLNPTYFALVFRKPDKIKLVSADKPAIAVIQNAVTSHWTLGVHQMGKDKDGFYEIRFHGTPFSRNGSSSSGIQAKRMCCEILAQLHSIGWTLSLCSNLSQVTDLTTWFFHRAIPDETTVTPTPSILINNASQRTSVCCLSVFSCDGLRLINAPHAMNAVLKRAIVHNYEPGLSFEQSSGPDYEVKLNGYPWTTTDLDEGIKAKRLLLEIFKQFDVNNYVFYGTANLKGTNDCMFFVERETKFNSVDYAKNVNDYAMIQLNDRDIMTVVNLQKRLIDRIRFVISKSWKKRIITESNFHCAWQFKLAGSPWWSDGEEGVQSRHLMTAIFQSLLSQGVCLLGALHLTCTRGTNKAMFVMRMGAEPANERHVCLSFSETNKIRLINGITGATSTAATTTQGVEEFREIVRQSILDGWNYGLKRSGENFGSYEFKLGSNPWSSSLGCQHLQARKMLCLLLKQMADQGWRVLCSADVASKYSPSGSHDTPDYPLDVHSWFFVKSSVPG